MNRVVLRAHHRNYGMATSANECYVCNSRGVPGMYHRHFSTAYLRQQRVSAGHSSMDCPVCQTSHTTDLNATPRVKVFMSSSTNNGFWQADEWDGTLMDGVCYHFEMEAVGGLKLLGGRRIWSQLYDQVAKNIDTHCTIGLNDILQLARIPDEPGLSPDEQVDRRVDIFMERVNAFHQTTRDHANRHRLSSPNRFSISTVL